MDFDDTLLVCLGFLGFGAIGGAGALGDSSEGSSGASYATPFKSLFNAAITEKPSKIFL